MSADLSPRGRIANLARMRSDSFDVLVVGGGIVGAGIARDAAERGLKTALVERGDFASGTSGKTSRLVHGGLRYLKNFKVSLVRQAVRERDVLIRESPALVRPLAFTIPAYEGRGMGPLTLRFGLWVYDLLSRDKVLPRRRWLSPDGTRSREPGLAAAGLRGSGLYHDALTNDARLVLAVIRSAADAGAIVANYAESLELLREAGRVSGTRIRDRIRQETFEVRASVIVNATGVWLDRLRANRAAPTLRPTKGIHIFLPRDRVGNREAVVLSAKTDGRMMFVLPWGTLTLVGTTDTDFSDDPEQVLPTATDVAYLLDALNEAFPGARVGPADVVSAYAGLRPLLRKKGASTESDVSREHEIFEDGDGLVSVAGGKLTTHRAMAKEVVDRVCDRIGKRAPCRTGETGFGPALARADEIGALGIEKDAAQFLASRHPVDDVRACAGRPSATSELAPSLPYRWIDVDMAVECEMAHTLEDILVRRLGIFYESADQGLSLTRGVAERAAIPLGWTPDHMEQEIASYRQLVAAHRRFLEQHDS